MAPWKDYTPKRTVESVRRINAREAYHVNARVIITPMPQAPTARRAGHRSWCLCPHCKGRVAYLYQVDAGGPWRCRRCHNLTYRSSQQSHTVAAMQSGLVAAWENYCFRLPVHSTIVDFFQVIHSSRADVEAVSRLKMALIGSIWTAFCIDFAHKWRRKTDLRMSKEPPLLEAPRTYSLFAYNGRQRPTAALAEYFGVEIDALGISCLVGFTADAQGEGAELGATGSGRRAEALRYADFGD